MWQIESLNLTSWKLDTPTDMSNLKLTFTNLNTLWLDVKFESCHCDIKWHVSFDISLEHNQELFFVVRWGNVDLAASLKML